MVTWQQVFAEILDWDLNPGLAADCSVYDFKLAVMSAHVLLDALSKLVCKSNPVE